jgi:hypothetical protein
MKARLFKRYASLVSGDSFKLRRAKSLAQQACSICSRRLQVP